MKNNLLNFSAILGFVLLCNLPQPTAQNVSKPADTLTCSLAAPRNFETEVVSRNTVVLTWSAVSDAASYSLKLYNISGDKPVYIGEFVESAFSVTISGLATGATYQFVLASMCTADSVSDVTAEMFFVFKR